MIKALKIQSGHLRYLFGRDWPAIVASITHTVLNFLHNLEKDIISSISECNDCSYRRASLITIHLHSTLTSAVLGQTFPRLKTKRNNSLPDNHTCSFPVSVSFPDDSTDFFLIRRDTRIIRRERIFVTFHITNLTL